MPVGHCCTSVNCSMPAQRIGITLLTLILHILPEMLHDFLVFYRYSSVHDYKL